MANAQSSRWFTLFQRELQEYRVSLLWTPLITALLLTGVMLVSVVVANRISAVGEAFIEVVTQDESLSGMNIRIQIDDDSSASDEPSFRIERNVDTASDAEWNFSREWTFTPQRNPDPVPDSDRTADQGGASFNALLSVVNILMNLILVAVTVNYLLGSLYDDRRDRSILFWKSMPVSEWEVVLSKLAVALVVAPLAFLAASLLTQLMCTLLAMVMVWRLEMDPLEQVLANIHFGRLLVDQVGGLIVTSLWVAPVYAWLLLASAAARRSPFMMAAVPLVGLALVEELLFGTEFLRNAVVNHIPQVGGGAGFDQLSPEWSSLNLPSMAAGLVCSAGLVTAAVWLRKHRWEI